MSENDESKSKTGKKTVVAFIVAVVLTAAVTFAIAALLVNILERKSEARNPYVKFVEIDNNTTDPAVWGTNWPMQYNQYLRTVDTTRTKYGGSEAMPEQKLDRDPWLKRMYSGYAFALDYRDRRGHAYMLSDQEQTERVLKRPQPGACLHCHASVLPTYRRIGAEALGETIASGTDFNWPAVFKGFELVSAMKYADAHAELLKTPDGSPPPTGGAPGRVDRAAPTDLQGAPTTAPTTQQALAAHAGIGDAHPVSCVDCHDPDNMQLRVTRPGFVRGIQALAASDAPVPHLPSIERWRQGNRNQPYDPNRDATRQEMRSFACGQCHVEYYFRGDSKVVTYPWHNGLRAEQIEAYYDEPKNFPNGQAFNDWKHGETGAGVIKAQHPEFEMWSQGVHARAGVSCADCHMPYYRQGAMKISDHWVRSPLLMVNRSCQTCHSVPEQELAARVETIQGRTHHLMSKAAAALTDMLDAIRSAKAAGATPEQLAPAHALQRQAQWRLDFVSSENSMGFHADQETARVLGESIDFARQAQVAALSIRTPQAPAATQPAEPVHGVTPTEAAPPGPYRTQPENR